MARLSYEELEKIKKKHGVQRLWSWSRMNTYMTSKFEYLLKYILKSKEDRCDSCYTTLGTICHDTLEKFYEGEIEYKDMIDDYNDGFTTAITIAELKFNRSDEEKNKSIGEKYNENLIHFFKNHVPYKYKVLVEKPIVVNIIDENADDEEESNVFVGYIDALYKDDDENYHILDFKSSSIYTGKTLEENSGQLILYSIGLHQMGIPFDKIKPQFNFLKYCTIKYEQKNGAIKYRNVERCKIGESLQSNAKTWLKHFNYEPDEYLKAMLDTNGIECLPEEVKEKYEITDCHVDVELNDKIVLKWSNHVVLTLKDIKLREMDYEATKALECFWDDEEDVKAQSYYFANLCSYSASKHLPYKAYLEKFEAAQKGEDMFSGIGGSTATSSKVIENNANEVDLSWLDNL
jgi:hypothetical protein